MINTQEYLDENKKLIQKIANRFNLYTSKFTRDDLIQEGNLAAIKALEKFDPTRGTKVSTYVYMAVYREMRDFVRKNKTDVYETVYGHRKRWLDSGEEEFSDGTSKLMAYRLDSGPNNDDTDTLKSIVPSGAPPVVDELIKQEQIDILLEEIEELPDRERDIVKSRYFDGAKLAEIAREQDCSRQRIDQISRRAMERLGAKVKSRLNNELFI